jgi:hypothetical protein
MHNQLELNLWDALEVARSNPDRASIGTLCQKLDGLDLILGGDAIAEIANIYRARADILLLQLSREYLPPTEPILTDEMWAHLFQHSFRFNDRHLYVESVNDYPSSRQSVLRVGADASLVVEEAILEFEGAIALAHGEYIQGWANLIQATIVAEGEMSLTQLQQRCGLSMVDVWLGLLLGDTGCVMELVGGDFYDSSQIRVRVQRNCSDMVRSVATL